MPNLKQLIDFFRLKIFNDFNRRRLLINSLKVTGYGELLTIGTQTATGYGPNEIVE